MNGMQMHPTSHDVFGMLVIAAGAIATLWTIGLAIYWVIRPGEADPSHPKRLILRNDR